MRRESPLFANVVSIIIVINSSNETQLSLLPRRNTHRKSKRNRAKTSLNDSVPLDASALMQKLLDFQWHDLMRNIWPRLLVVYRSLLWNLAPLENLKDVSHGTTALISSKQGRCLFHVITCLYTSNSVSGKTRGHQWWLSRSANVGFRHWGWLNVKENADLWFSRE